MLRKLIVIASLALCGTAQAGVVTSAIGAVINSGGPGAGAIADTYNQAGLATRYVSGVTDFASYIAADPRHTNAFGGAEWFSAFDSTSASVTYDLGSVRAVSALALWNEEASGIGALNLYQSIDGLMFTLLAAGLAPTDNSGADYGADVFSFTGTNARYIRLDMSGCPQANTVDFYPSCAIGEVAFDTNAVVADIPEPASMALLGLGLAGIAGLRRRRHR